MTNIVVTQMPAFKNTYRKLHLRDKLQVNDVIKAIIQNPKIGQEKKGDLSGMFVYKFKMDRREILLAYEWNFRRRFLLAIGIHEIFYRNLKKCRK
ncbi:MAG: type II toxin-antitoxin system RelE/ParE family toxin [Candidatus Aquirickettsiella sp.]